MEQVQTSEHGKSFSRTEGSAHPREQLNLDDGSIEANSSRFLLRFSVTGEIQLVAGKAINGSKQKQRRATADTTHTKKLTM